MLRPEEVPDVPDDGSSESMKHCEEFIDAQLRKNGTKGGVAVVDLPKGMEWTEVAIQVRYASAGWIASGAGMGRIKLERPTAMNPQTKPCQCPLC